MNRITFGILLFCLIFLANCQPYRKVIHKTDSEAKCLDGTPPAVYLHDGGDHKNFLILFMGGGYCAGVSIDGTLQTCYQRTKTMFGSSDLLPQEFNGQGYLSPDPAKNRFSTWVKIIINYCDGSMHQGYTESPIQYKDTRLYFRGAANVRSHAKWLINTYNLADADRLVLTGVSAGGIATFIWADYFKSLMKNPQGFYSVPDSSIFLNEPSVVTGMFKLDVSFKNLYLIANMNEKTPLSECNNENPGEQYKCLFLQYAYKYITVPTLLINSEYDSWGIPNILDIFCSSKGQISGYTLKNCNQTQLFHIEEYRNKFASLISHCIENSNSVWTISCSNHGYALLDDFYNVNNQRIPEKTGYTVKQAIEKFVLDSQKVLAFDSVSWPGNTGCAY